MSDETEADFEQSSQCSECRVLERKLCLQVGFYDHNLFHIRVKSIVRWSPKGYAFCPRQCSIISVFAESRSIHGLPPLRDIKTAAWVVQIQLLV
uniref:Uncharacterized protein n=1 Tax=Setaria digitata TaxID=48799 RepID=A0A915PZL4_9BILA